MVGRPVQASAANGATGVWAAPGGPAAQSRAAYAPTAAARIAQASGPAAVTPAPWRGVPSGLFPSGPQRPTYREPLPVVGGRVALGVFAGAVWLGLFAALAGSARSYAWCTIIATLLAAPVLAVLARFGDRGIAVGAAASTGIGLALATLIVALRWFAGDWILW
jgi:hypothetical protein